MSDFSYDNFRDPGAEIRLLEIYPGKAGDRLEGSIAHHRLDDLPPYEAISYTWGDGQTLNTIVLNEKEASIRGNSYNALLELRNPDSPRLVWIDAVCINQSHLVEKSSQVYLMSTIYQKAHTVIIWFSEPRQRSDLLASLFEQFHTWFVTDKRTFLEVCDADYIERTRHAPEYIALRNFLCHPWWKRIWTLQEAVLANRLVLVYGTEIIDWDYLVRVLHWDNFGFGFEVYRLYQQERADDIHPRQEASSLSWLPASGQGYMSFMEIAIFRHLAKTNASIPLWTALCQANSRLATDPRDYVYGLLGMARHTSSLDITPDYTMSVEGVYQQCTLIIMGENPDAWSMVLKFAGCGHRRRFSKLPSYIPDWTVSFSEVIMTGVDNNASGHHKDFIVSLLEDGLQVQGYLFEEVKDTLTFSTRDVGVSDDGQMLVWLDELERFAFGRAIDPFADMESISTSDSLKLNALWVLLGGMFDDPTSDLGLLKKIKHGYTTFKRWLIKTEAKNQPSKSENPMPSTEHGADVLQVIFEALLETLCDVTGHARYCVTSSGLLGKGPPLCREGDIVSIFLGCPRPYLLRRLIENTGSSLSDHNQRFNLVGACNVNGIMLGEAVQLMETAGQASGSIVLV